MSYDSKYTGKQVEELLDQVPNKVDKVDGKQLSTEDFTTVLKNKLDGLSNYDDSEISEAVNTLRKDFDTLVSGDSTTAIKTFNEIIAFLSGIEDSESLDSIIASIEQQIAGKQDTIADLATIREGAGKGATAVQPSSLATVATSGSYNDLSSKPSIPTTLAGLTDDSTHRTVTDTEKATWNAKSNFSGSYNDLANKPTIPAAVTVDTALSTTSTNPVQNKAITTGINAKYTKPSTGIPESDLAAAVQASLGKADTALQSEQYKGTITGVSANGTSVATSGVANIPAASTSEYGVTKLSSATNSTSTTLAATASAVKSAYDLANGKQAKLVSGTNIKTINNQSILGSGDIAIGGNGDSGVVKLVAKSPQSRADLGSAEVFIITKGEAAICIPANGVPSMPIVALLDDVPIMEDPYSSSVDCGHYHFFVPIGGVTTPFSIGANVEKLTEMTGNLFWQGGLPTIDATDGSGYLEVDILAVIYNSTPQSILIYGMWSKLKV